VPCRAGGPRPIAMITTFTLWLYDAPVLTTQANDVYGGLSHVVLAFQPVHPIGNHWPELGHESLLSG
jgi:hypothetical protein